MHWFDCKGLQVESVGLVPAARHKTAERLHDSMLWPAKTTKSIKVKYSSGLKMKSVVSRNQKLAECCRSARLSALVEVAQVRHREMSKRVPLLSNHESCCDL